MSDSTVTSENPLLERPPLPPFERIEAEHVVPAVRELLGRLNERLEQLERDTPPGWAVVEELTHLEYELDRTWGPVGHLLGVKNSPELRAAYEEVQPEVVAIYLRAGQSRPVYEALDALRKDNAQWSALSAGQQRAVELRLRDMEHAGVGLPEDKRERYNEIARELSKLSTDFSNHVLDATKAYGLDLSDRSDIEGLPESYLNLAAQSYNNAHAEEIEAGKLTKAVPESGPWRASLDLPGFLPFMEHGKRRDLRETLYRAYLSRASSGELDNTPLIDRILTLRKEQAGLLGFHTWAELSLNEKMAGSVEEVDRLLEELRSASYDAAQKDLTELQQRAKKDGITEIKPWDVAYYSERLREERFQFTDEELRPYFPLPRVLEGLFGLAARLFGVRIVAKDGEAPVWHEDVRYFAIEDEQGERVAAFYLDPYSRPENKRGGAWMGDCIGRRRLSSGEVELPVAYLVCNGTPPVGDKPSLMTFRDVETLFHEFGHGLQHMLTRVDYADVAGISGVEWDAVELPSQFMENWCYHKPTLLGMTAHYESGAPMPDELFERLKAARTFRAASAMLRQLRFAMLDMELHHRYAPATSSESVFEVQKRIDEKTSLIAPLDEDRFLCSFGHIFAGGYSAGYYSYKWAEVLSADAFSAFEEAGLDNESAVAETGRRFRETVLALGGSKHPMEVFEEFRGRKPTTEPLLRHSGLTAA